MAHTLAIHWNKTRIDLVRVRHGVGRSSLESIDSMPIKENANSTEVGRILSSMLANHSSGRNKVVIALGRKLLNWQHISLPPCPAEDLPDLVHLQMLQESTANGNAYDYLPLVGDENNLNRIWTITSKGNAISEIEKVCTVAELKPDYIVPLCLGYPALDGNRTDPSGDTSRISIAVHPTESILWAESEGRIVLFRQLNLPENGEIESLVSALTGEARRSMLSLSQEISNSESLSLRLIHSNPEIAKQIHQGLCSSLDRNVELFELSADFEQAGINESTNLPLIALAMQESYGKAPLVDLLHPRQRPAPPSRARTYILSTIAAACLLVFAGMTSLKTLQQPLNAAEAAKAKTEELQPKVDYYAQAEKHAAEIEEWQKSSINLLNTLEGLSTMLRPEKLDTEDFPLEEDTVLERFDLSGKQLIIHGVVREDSKVLPIESKLRKRVVRVQREQSEPDTDISGYPWGYKFVIDLTDLKPIAEESVQ